MPVVDSTPCGRCGHPWRAHEHFRRGTECSLCAPGDCPAFRGPRLIDRILRRPSGR
ncbi:hypothetical protein FHX74_000245 [Friedmanniella endophytica]|uniref:Uncharacterized protein n=1 Tax=Microlunatus kandeliicorticis TaxID=1759536 RepID=A0A7W3IP44_9ACTN|nr:hypothetical protein [Microlunatus kandeliicorticis]